MPYSKQQTLVFVKKPYLQLPSNMILSTLLGDVAQLGERDNRTVEARGSSPLISTRRARSIGPLRNRCLAEIRCLANRKGVWYSIDTVANKSSEQE